MAVEFRFVRARQHRGPVRVDTEPNLNLLAHAQLEELEIGSRCGGHGRCGGDRVQVRVQGAGAGSLLSPVTEAERSHLSAEELASGWRLACQCWPESPDAELVIEVS